MKKDSPFRAIRVYFAQFRHRGGIEFLRQNVWKLLVLLVAVAVGLALIDRYLLTDGLRNWMRSGLSPIWLTVILLISESALGILPPDLFLWAVKDKNDPWLWVGTLSVASYIGGIASFFIGKRLYKVPKIRRWVEETYREQMQQIGRYGGILIVVAAMTPLPFSPVSILAGAIRYPTRRYLSFAAVRFLRFFLYAWTIFQSEDLFYSWIG